MRRLVISVSRPHHARLLGAPLATGPSHLSPLPHAPVRSLTPNTTYIREFTEMPSEPPKVEEDLKEEVQLEEEVDDETLIEMFSTRATEWWHDNDNVKTFLDFLVRKLEITSLERWYKVTSKQVRSHGGARLIDARGGLSTVIPSMYPDHEWYPWKFERVPYDFWNNTMNQKRYMKWLAETLNKEEGKPEDWYGITKTDFAHNYGAHLLTKYQYSPFKLFSALYPEGDWVKWGFARSTAGFWDEVETQREYLDWLGEKLGYKDKEDWYGIAVKDFVENHGGGLLKVHYNNDPSAIVMKIYSDYTWVTWKFASIPSNFWDQVKTRKEYIEWLKKTVDVSDEAKLKSDHFIENHGAGLLAKYGNSPSAVLQSLREVEKPTPEEPPKKTAPTDSPETNRNYWRSRENQKLFVEEFGRAMGIEPGEHEKWYKVTYEDFHNHGGAWIKRYYDNSLYLLMKTLYPEHLWIAYKFETPKKPEPGAPAPEKIDWSRVSQAQLQAMGIARVIRMHNGLENALAKMNKTTPKPKSFGTVSWNKKANQRLIVVFLREFFPGMEVIEDILHPDIRYEETGRRMQLDVYVPDLRLAIEYQGAQHYHQTNVFGDVGERVILDAEKEVACIAADISLITVPYWWDMRRESLLKTILDKRPDLSGKISPGKMDPSLIPPEEPLPDILA